ncbi:hypothetical protein AGMMS49959_16990 [Planctomycetales bacterium]|nr:hypothetical protein AGMMS49959_16990 [Planctomycetales bacterium]
MSIKQAEKLFDIMDALKELGFGIAVDPQHFTAHFNFLIKENVRFFKTQLFELCAYGFITKVAFDHWDTEKIIENMLVRWYPFYCEFSSRLFASDKISLNDQKFQANAILQQKISEGSHSRNVYTDIFVDEFQDVSPLDLQFINSLVTHYKSHLVVVGDDDQTIFEFRGSSPNFIITPDRYFAGQFSTFTLGVNYRSPRNIVDISQKLIVRNKNRVPKAISTSSVNDAEIAVVEKRDSAELFEYVMNAVKTELNGNLHQRIALIARKRSQLLPYEVLFTKEGIDYFTPDDLNMFLDRAFSELSNLLELKKKLLQHPEWVSSSDIMALCHKVGRYEIKKSDKLQLSTYLEQKLSAKTPDEVYFTLKGSGGCCQFMNRDAGEKTKKEKFSDACARAVRDFLNAKTVSGTIQVFSEEFEGFAKDYGKSDDAIFYTDPPFYHLIDFAAKYKADFDVFLHDIELTIAKSRTVSLRNDDDAGNANVNKRLHLTTALRIKGEEYDAVYVLDANAEIWPNKFAKESDELESERRLFYVATTRARKKLLFAYSTCMRETLVAPSPYLNEMGLI